MDARRPIVSRWPLGGSARFADNGHTGALVRKTDEGLDRGSVADLFAEMKINRVGRGGVGNV